MSSKKKIFIIGTGWYGCHIATYLINKGYDITIGDKSDNFFSGSSSKNQNRLHLGFHYPRSLDTIKECIVGFNKFSTIYSDFLEPINNNLYFIHKDSLVSLEEYKSIFITNNRLINLKDINFIVKNVDEYCINVNEKFINNIKAAKYFDYKLRKYFVRLDSIRINYDKIDKCIYLNDSKYDYIINCTNNQFLPFDSNGSLFYELYCSLIYKINFIDITGITIMDGNFFSIYPYDLEKKLYTVTHVKHGVIKNTQNFDDLLNYKDIDVNSVKELIERDVFEVLPDIKNIWEYQTFFISYKTKYINKDDDRSLRYFISDKYASFSGGKITGIFQMESIIDSLIQ